MTTGTLVAPQRLFAPNGGEAITLDDLMTEVVEDLALRERARCPVCAGELIAHGPDDGRCRDCGAALS